MRGDPIEFPRDPHNGMIIGPDDCHYDNEKQVFHFAVLGLCGCGYPDEAYNFVLEILKLADRRKNRDEPFSWSQPKVPWVNLSEEVAKLIVAQPEQAAHAILHLLDTRCVIEHGSGIGGSWASRLGEQMIDAGPVEEELDPPE